jgi:hypothetical protein
MMVCAVTVFGWIKGNMHEHCVIVHRSFTIERTDGVIAAIFAQMKEHNNVQEYEREGLHVAVRWEQEDIKESVKKLTDKPSERPVYTKRSNVTNTRVERRGKRGNPKTKRTHNNNEGNNGQRD